MKYQEHPQHCGKTSLKDRNLQNNLHLHNCWD